jgi:hypothetical protein
MMSMMSIILTMVLHQLLQYLLPIGTYCRYYCDNSFFGIESDYISYHSLVKLMNLFPLWVSYADYYSSVRFSII